MNIDDWDSRSLWEAAQGYIDRTGHIRIIISLFNTENVENSVKEGNELIYIYYLLQKYSLESLLY